MDRIEYSDVVLDHFKNPRNVGKIEHPSGEGTVGNPVCGDMMEISILVEDGVISDIKFRTYGCASAIASTSMLTEMVKGMKLEEAEKVTWNRLLEGLKGLPKIKIHCSTLAIQGLKKALYDYYSNQGIERPDLWSGDDDMEGTSCDHP